MKQLDRIIEELSRELIDRRKISLLNLLAEPRNQGSKTYDKPFSFFDLLPFMVRDFVSPRPLPDDVDPVQTFAQSGNGFTWTRRIWCPYEVDTLPEVNSLQTDTPCGAPLFEGQTAEVYVRTPAGTRLATLFWEVAGGRWVPSGRVLSVRGKWARRRIV